MIRILLAKLGNYLVERFYVSKGPTYTVRLGRIQRKYPRPDIRAELARAAWKNRQEKSEHNKIYKIWPHNY